MEGIIMLTLPDSDSVKVTDKNGNLREITVAQYEDALMFYHSALRAAWLQSKGG